MNTNIHTFRRKFDNNTTQATPKACHRAAKRSSSIRYPREYLGRCVGGRYQLVKQVGVGGMAVVFKAIQLAFNRTVAVKVMMPDRAQELNLAEQFEIEARAARRLTHPHIVDVFDHGQDGDLRYITMEYLKGETLESLLRREGPLSPFRAVTIVNQVLGSLSAAHAKGVFHHDIKPGNVFILNSGFKRDFVKIIDFGLARVLDLAFPPVAVSPKQAVFGSPRFMSPEQITQNHPDHLSDIYSVGILLWTLLLGQPPFNGVSTSEILRQHLSDEPPSFCRARRDVVFPRLLEAIVRRALNKRRERRFASALAFQEALKPFANGLCIDFP